MIPLLVLLGVFAVCRVSGWIGVEFFREWQHCLRFFQRMHGPRENTCRLVVERFPVWLCEHCCKSFSSEW